MKAMILAAGRGERLRPLTLQTPKPLLQVRGQSLIARHLAALARAGVREVVINLSWLGEQIRAALGDGAGFGLRIHYSDEGPVPLETGGGILRALPLLGPDPFVLVSADIYTDFDPGSLALEPGALGHLMLVPNPAYHPQGDFALRDGRIAATGEPRYTYGNVGLIHPELFAGWPPGRFPLLPVLQRAIAQGRLYGELYTGCWANVGTAEELAALARE